ncbi:DUF1302 family protein [Oleomonas cavernae]|uniref:DUF1302 family protein n=1 Tax=Oleomonas cavernae TaxID=2320859 RepID=A0A418WUX6_9PROT|nr:DUF1302 family protein [Oleomonas cavernae]
MRAPGGEPARHRCPRPRQLPRGLQRCPFLHALTHPQPAGGPVRHGQWGPAGYGAPQLEYPENIQLYGLSFNTTIGDFSIQGRGGLPSNLPLQVDLQDLAFAALGPTLTRCHDRSVGCLGSAELANIGIATPRTAWQPSIWFQRLRRRQRRNAVSGSHSMSALATSRARRAPSPASSPPTAVARSVRTRPARPR